MIPPPAPRTVLTPTWLAVVVALLAGMLVGVFAASFLIAHGRTCTNGTTNGGLTVVETCTREVTP